MIPDKTVYFVHISDSHIGPTADYERHGLLSLPCARQAVLEIKNLPQKPDFVMHTGDVVTEPHSDSYQLAAEVFAELDVPIYYAVGNHDTAADIKAYLPMGEHTLISDDPNRLAYTFDVKGYRFLVLDSRAPDGMDPQGRISPSQLSAIRSEAVPYGMPLTLFIHHPVWPLNSPWTDPSMLLTNGGELHDLLLPARERIRGVFHGHVHQHMQTTRNGICYTSVASTFAQFQATPVDHEPVFLYDPPGYNFVHLQPEQTIVHQHTFPRPTS